MTTPTQAGWIVCDRYGTIHGYCTDHQGAWDDAYGTFKDTGIAVLRDVDEPDENHGSWIFLSDLKSLPASSALLHHVMQHGGACSWGRVNGIACTVAQAIAHQSKD